MVWLLLIHICIFLSAKQDAHNSAYRHNEMNGFNCLLEVAPQGYCRLLAYSRIPSFALITAAGALAILWDLSSENVNLQ